MPFEIPKHFNTETRSMIAVQYIPCHQPKTPAFLLRSYGELNKSFQAVAARMTDYSKRSFEEATCTFEQLVGAKSLEHAIEIQSQYTKKAYDNWMAEASKLSELYVNGRHSTMARCATSWADQASPLTKSSC